MKIKLRSTLLKTALINKAKALQMLIATSPSEQTAEMLLGSLAHCALLEPEKFDKRYEAYEGAQRISISFKKAEKSGKTPVKLRIANQAKEMAEVLYKKYLANETEILEELKASTKESNITHEDDDYIYNIKPDGFTENYVFEYKTTSLPAAEMSAWIQMLSRYKYGLQIYFYNKVLSMAGKRAKKGFIQIIQSTEAPYVVRTFFTPTEIIENYADLELEYQTSLSIINELISQINPSPTYLEKLTNEDPFFSPSSEEVTCE